MLGVTVLVNLVLARRGLQSGLDVLGTLAHTTTFTLLALVPSITSHVANLLLSWLAFERSETSRNKPTWLIALVASIAPAGLVAYLALTLQRGDALTVAALLGSFVLLATASTLRALPREGVWLRRLRGAASLTLVAAAAAALWVSASQLGLRYRAIGTLGCLLGTAFGAAGLSALTLPARSGLVLTFTLGGLALVSAVVTHGKPAAAALTPVGRLVIGAGYSPEAERRGATPLEPLPDPSATFARRSGLPAITQPLAGFNFLLITAEATRFDQTSLAQPTLPTTPELAGLAGRGAYVFTRAYSPSNGTLASMSSLLSLTFPSATELTTWRTSWHGELRPAAQTLAELFGEAGFGTFRVNHNFKGSIGSKIRGFEQGFGTTVLEPELTSADGKTIDPRIAASASRLLRDARANGKPFFGWVFFGSPHAPYHRHFPELPGATPLELYRQELRFMDRALGQVLRTLDETGLAENTVILFAADHGEEFYEHGGAGHLTLHDECLHVPLVVRIPGQRGEVITTPTSTLYALLWLLTQQGSPIQQAALARLRSDIAPMLEATKGAVIAEMVGHDAMRTALTLGTHKAICDVAAGWCDVFDLGADPGERIPLPASEHTAPIRDSFQRYLQVRRSIGKSTTQLDGG